MGVFRPRPAIDLGTSGVKVGAFDSRARRRPVALRLPHRAASARVGLKGSGVVVVSLSRGPVRRYPAQLTDEKCADSVRSDRHRRSCASTRRGGP